MDVYIRALYNDEIPTLISFCRLFWTVPRLSLVMQRIIMLLSLSGLSVVRSQRPDQCPEITTCYLIEEDKECDRTETFCGRCIATDNSINPRVSHFCNNLDFTSQDCSEATAIRSHKNGNLVLLKFKLCAPLPTPAPVTRPPVTRPPVTRPPVTRPPKTRPPKTPAPVPTEIWTPAPEPTPKLEIEPNTDERPEESSKTTVIILGALIALTAVVVVIAGIMGRKVWVRTQINKTNDVPIMEDTSQDRSLDQINHFLLQPKL